MSRYIGSLKNKKRTIPTENKEDPIMDFDTPPSSFLAPTPEQEQEPELELNRPRETCFLSMDGPAESSKALACYMAFYAFLQHDWIRKEPEGERTHFRDFKHMFCSMRSQFPGPNTEGEGFTPQQLVEMRKYLQKQKTPPSFLPSLICSSPRIEEWFGMPLELVETVRDLVKLHSTRNQGVISTHPSSSEAIESPKTQDPQAAVWHTLFPFLIELLQSPNVKINLLPTEASAYSNDISMTAYDIAELKACFAMAPSKCSVLPQLSTNKLCCVRYSKAHLQPSFPYPSGVYSRADVELTPSPHSPPSGISTQARQQQVLEFFRPVTGNRPPYTPQIAASISKKAALVLPPHFFISDSYAERLEAFWICININSVVAGMAFDWYTERVVLTKRKLTAEAAMKAFYAEKVGEVVEFWKIYMKILYQFLTDTRESLQKTWGSKLQ